MVRVRRQRSIWFGIVVVVVFFAAVTLAVGLVGSAGPDIPHAADHAACATCHPTDQLPEGHAGRVDGSCRTCHSEATVETVPGS
jgi:hypothetical protein